MKYSLLVLQDSPDTADEAATENEGISVDVIEKFFLLEPPFTRNSSCLTYTTIGKALTNFIRWAGSLLCLAEPVQCSDH